MTTRWRCTQCDAVVTEAQFVEHEMAKFAKYLEEADGVPRPESTAHYHRVYRASGGHKGFYGGRMIGSTCGPVELEHPTEHHLAIEFLVGKVI